MRCASNPGAAQSLLRTLQHSTACSMARVSDATETGHATLAPC